MKAKVKSANLTNSLAQAELLLSKMSPIDVRVQMINPISKSKVVWSRFCKKGKDKAIDQE